MFSFDNSLSSSTPRLITASFLMQKVPTSSPVINGASKERMINLPGLGMLGKESALMTGNATYGVQLE